MINPLADLPKQFQRVIGFLNSHTAPSRLVALVIGLLATLWFLIRVAPKPSRTGYPCMQVTAPIMSGFVIYTNRFNVKSTKGFCGLFFYIQASHSSFNKIPGYSMSS